MFIPKTQQHGDHIYIESVLSGSAPPNDSNGQLQVKCQPGPGDAPKLVTLLGQCTNDSKGLRIDLTIVLHNGQELWIDHGNTHSTQSSMLQRTSKFMLDLYAVENNHGGKIDEKHKLFQQASPTIAVMVKSKTRCYTPLVKLIQAQIPMTTIR
jgi:hypothetical protein